MILFEALRAFQAGSSQARWEEGGEKLALSPSKANYDVTPMNWPSSGLRPILFGRVGDIEPLQLACGDFRADRIIAALFSLRLSVL